jgi:hypothetical protein
MFVRKGMLPVTGLVCSAFAAADALMMTTDYLKQTTPDNQTTEGAILMCFQPLD